MGRQYKQLGGKIWILLEARIFNTTDGSKSEKVTRVLKLGWNLTVPVYIQQLVPPPGQFLKYFSSKSPKLNFYP